MNSISLQPTTTDMGLPLPRLIVRVGVCGQLPSLSDVELRASLLPTLVQALTETFDQIDSSLLRIHHEDSIQLHRWLDRPGYFKTHLLARWLGKADRWSRSELWGTPASAFSVERPLVSLLHGSDRGVRPLLRSASRARCHLTGVEHNLIRIVTKSPDSCPSALGIGTVAAVPPDQVELSTLYGKQAELEAILHHSDILIALWEENSGGLDANLLVNIERAIESRIPVLAIRLGSNQDYRIDLLLNSEQLLSIQRRRPILVNSDWNKALDGVLNDILAFPDTHVHADVNHHQPSSYEPRSAFAVFREDRELSAIWPARFWTLFDAYSKYRSASTQLEKTKLAWKELLKEDVATRADNSESFRVTQLARNRQESELNSASEKMQEAVWSLFAWTKPVGLPKAKPAPPDSFEHCYKRVKDRAASSGMSGIFGNAHRGAIIVSYLLAALAVTLAIVGGILHLHHMSEELQIAIAMAEMFVIFLMYTLSVCSAAEDWNAAYTDTRILAEAVRMMEFLGPLGVHTPLPRLPYYLQGDADTPAPEEMWTVWYFRALVRMAPLRLNHGQSFSIQKNRAAVLKVAEEQIDYHHKNARKQEQIHWDIHWWSDVLFVAVFLCAFLHVIDLLIDDMLLDDKFLRGDVVFSLSLVVCVVGPALISALHGFASQIEHARLRQRSSSMVKLLNGRVEALKSINTQTPTSVETIWGTTTEALAIASLMMDETGGWSMLYKNADIHAG